MKGLIFLFIGVSLLMLSCVIPEKFICDINIAKDGKYSVAAKGTLVFYTVFDEIKNQGRVSEETDSDIKSFFDGAIKEEPAIKKYQYQKNGRAYIEYFKEVKDGTSLDLSSSGLPLKIIVNPDGAIIIEASALSDGNKEQLEEFSKYGYKLDGTIKITSELPIIDAGGQKVGNKYFLFGPKVISRVVRVNTLPEKDIVIIIGSAGVTGRLSGEGGATTAVTKPSTTDFRATHRIKTNDGSNLIRQ